MPNYVTTELHVQGPSAQVLAFVEKAKRAATQDEPGSSLTFDAFIPMPKELKIEESSTGSFGYDLFVLKKPELLDGYWAKKSGATTLEGLQLWVDLEQPQARQLGEAYARNEEAYGHKSWYDWSIANWGTKWDAGSVSEPDVLVTGESASVTYHFDTAWSPCEPVIEAMSEQFPELEFRATFDEESHAFYYEAVWSEGVKVEHTELARDDDDDDDDDEDEDGESGSISAQAEADLAAVLTLEPQTADAQTSALTEGGQA